MATTASLQDLAKRHLWLHFSRMGAYQGGAEIPIIVRGDGCHVWDDQGNRYFDGLSALFCVNIGHGRADVAMAGAKQAEELGFFTNWNFAHPRAIELSARIAGLTPGNLNRVFFTSGGGEAVETAIKLSRQFHKLTGNPNKTKIIAREIAYHGTTLGALSATGITALREPFEPFTPGGCHVPNTNQYRLKPGYGPEMLADAVEERILFEGPSTVAAVIMEPVQNAGGCFTPPEGYFQRIREICDKYDVLMISDEVICSWGRLGEWFGAQRYGYQPDIITTAKGITSAYAPLGALIASDPVAQPFLEGDASFLHGFTFAGHPMACAVALANIDVMEHEGVIDNVREHQGAFRDMLDSLRDIPIVGDVRGDGYFRAIELVKDQGTKESFSDEESEWLLREFLSDELFRRGLICRADDRGDPVIQLSPPLIAQPEHFEEIEGILRPVLEEASRKVRAEPMLTIQELLGDLGDVEILAGEQALDAPMRWVHISELTDPTPWLSGGELLLTTGLGLTDARTQRKFVERLAEHGLAGLGFGVGFAHDHVPEAIVEAARERDFPLLEIPYELPFIAITEQAFTRLVNEEYALLRRSIAAQERLQRVVLAERGMDGIVGALAGLVGGTALVLDGRGAPLACRSFRRPLADEHVAAIGAEARRRARSGDAQPFAPDHPDLAGRALVLPVAAERGRAPQAWVAGVKDSGGLAEVDRLALHQGGTVVALELLRRRVADSTERRLAGDVLAGIESGELHGAELARRLEPFRLGAEVSVLIVEPALDAALTDALDAEALPSVVGLQDERAVALLPGLPDEELVEIAERVRARVATEAGKRVSAGAGRAVPAGEARRALHEARCALEARSMADTNGGGVGTWHDLGSFQLLLSLQDHEALGLFCDTLLGPIEAGEGQYGGELMRSLEAFIENNGQWERAAQQLYCHRHTLRYRIRRIEELTGRDLGSARDRIEFWLALRGKEIASR